MELQNRKEGNIFLVLDDTYDIKTGTYRDASSKMHVQKDPVQNVSKKDTHFAAYDEAIQTASRQGWTVLKETCPITGDVPLIQNQDGRKWSVAINGYIDDDILKSCDTWHSAQNDGKVDQGKKSH